VALTGNTVQSTYLDLVQLEKSGAGLPSHAGKEAAVYDGSGAQIIGRTAVRHWLDPHPDAAAFAETWEFSTTGDMTQAALETAGWTFSNCSGAVSNGVLWLTATAAARAKAYFTVSLSGDFDFTSCMIPDPGYASNYPPNNKYGGFGVGDETADVIHYACHSSISGSPQVCKYVNGDWQDHNGTLTFATSDASMPMLLRVSRVSGTVYITGGSVYSTIVEDDTALVFSSLVAPASVVDSTTFTRVVLPMTYTANAVGDKIGYFFIRRFQ